MKGRASRAVYMRLQPSLLSPPSDPEEREKKKKGAKKKKKGAKKNCTPPTITTAPGFPADDRPRLDLMIYGAMPFGWGFFCCDAILVSPLTAVTGLPQPCAAA